jgi:hypothetical protein
MFREQPTQDKGIDAHVEEVVDGRASDFWQPSHDRISQPHVH